MVPESMGLWHSDPMEIPEGQERKGQERSQRSHFARLRRYACAACICFILIFSQGGSVPREWPRYHCFLEVHAPRSLERQGRYQQPPADQASRRRGERKAQTRAKGTQCPPQNTEASGEHQEAAGKQGNGLCGMEEGSQANDSQRGRTFPEGDQAVARGTCKGPQRGRGARNPRSQRPQFRRRCEDEARQAGESRIGDEVARNGAEVPYPACAEYGNASQDGLDPEWACTDSAGIIPANHAQWAPWLTTVDQLPRIECPPAVGNKALPPQVGQIGPLYSQDEPSQDGSPRCAGSPGSGRGSEGVAGAEDGECGGPGVESSFGDRDPCGRIHPAPCEKGSQSSSATLVSLGLVLMKQACEKSDRSLLNGADSLRLICLKLGCQMFDSFSQALKIFLSSMPSFLERWGSFRWRLPEQKLSQDEFRLFLLLSLVINPILAMTIVFGAISLNKALQPRRTRKLVIVGRQRFSVCCRCRASRGRSRTRKWTFLFAAIFLLSHLTLVLGQKEPFKEQIFQSNMATNLDLHANFSSMDVSPPEEYPASTWIESVWCNPMMNHRVLQYAPWLEMFDDQHVQFCPLSAVIFPLLEEFVLLDELGTRHPDDAVSLMHMPQHPGLPLWSCTVHRDAGLTRDAFWLQQQMIQTRQWTQIWVAQPSIDWQRSPVVNAVLWDPRHCIRCTYEARPDVPHFINDRGPYLVRPQPQSPSTWNVLSFLLLAAPLAVDQIALLVYVFQETTLQQRFATTVRQGARGLPVYWFFDQFKRDHHCLTTAWCRIVSGSLVAWWNEYVRLENYAHIRLEEVHTDPDDPGSTCGTTSHLTSLIQLKVTLALALMVTSEGSLPATSHPPFWTFLEYTNEEPLPDNPDAPVDAFETPFVFDLLNWRDAAEHTGLEYLPLGQTLRVQRPISFAEPRRAELSVYAAGDLAPLQIIRQIETVWPDIGPFPEFDNSWRLHGVDNAFTQHARVPSADFEYVLRSDRDLTSGTGGRSAVIVVVQIGDWDWGLAYHYAVAVVPYIAGMIFMRDHATVELPDLPEPELYLNDNTWPMHEWRRLWHGDVIFLCFLRPTILSLGGTLDRPRSRSPLRGIQTPQPSTMTQTPVLASSVILSPGQGTYRRSKYTFRHLRGATIAVIRQEVLRHWPMLGHPQRWAPIAVHASFRASPFSALHDNLYLAFEYHLNLGQLHQSMLALEALRVVNHQISQESLAAYVCPQITTLFDILVSAALSTPCLTHATNLCEYWHNNARVDLASEIRIQNGDFFLVVIRQRLQIASLAMLSLSQAFSRRLHSDDITQLFPDNAYGNDAMPQMPDADPPTTDEFSGTGMCLFWLILTFLTLNRRLLCFFLVPVSMATKNPPFTLWMSKNLQTMDEFHSMGRWEVILDLKLDEFAEQVRGDPKSDIAVEMPRVIHVADALDFPPVQHNEQHKPVENGRGMQSKNLGFSVPFEEEDLVAFLQFWDNNNLSLLLPFPSETLPVETIEALIDIPFGSQSKFDALTRVTFYVDGSFFKDEQASGWSFVAIGTSPDLPSFLLGWMTAAITIDSDDPTWFGALKHDSHQAELSALFMAGWWALHLSADVDLVFVFDNMAAGMISAGRWTAQTEGPLAEAARSVHQWNEIRRRGKPASVQYSHIKSHTLHPWNELADCLAKFSSRTALKLSFPRVYDVSKLICGKFPLLPRMVWLWLAYTGDPSYPEGANGQVTWQSVQRSDFQQPGFVQPSENPQYEVDVDTYNFHWLRIASYNVSTLAEKGLENAARPEFLRAQFDSLHVTIAALQETRARSQLFIEAPEFWRFVSPAVRGCGGTELWFSKKIKFPDGSGWHKDQFTVTYFDPEILIMTVHTNFGLWGFANGHAPHSGRSDSERLAWWNKFKQQTKRISHCDYLFWCGDFNAQLSERIDCCVGDLLDDETNHNGQLLITTALEAGFWLPSTFSEHHCGPSSTWFSARCVKGRRLDFVTLSRRLQFHSLSTWVDYSLDAGQLHEDHSAVFLELYVQLSNLSIKHAPFASVDRKAVMDPKNRETICQLLQNVPQPDWECDVHSHCDKVFGNLFDQLVKHYPNSKMKPRKSYISDTSWFVRQQKQVVRKDLHALNASMRKMFLLLYFSMWKSTDGASKCMTAKNAICQFHHRIALNVQQMAKLQRLLCESLINDRKIYFEQLAQEASRAEPADVWQKLRKLGIGRGLRRKGKQTLPMLVDENGKPSVTPQESSELWRRHAETLEFGHATTRKRLWTTCIETQLQREQNDLFVPPESHLIPTISQLERGCRRVQAGKATGPDGVVGELYHCFPAQMAAILHPLAVKVFTHCAEPVSLKGGRLVKAWKGRGNTTDPANYRGLMITNHASKILHGVFRSFILPAYEVRALGMQLGGKRKAMVTHGAHAIRSFVSWTRRSLRPSAVLFVDIRTAFYRVVRPLIASSSRFHEQVIAIIQRFGLPSTALQELYRILDESTALAENDVPHCLEDLMDEFHSATWFEVDHGSTLTQTNAGSRPGDPLADITFSFLFMKVMLKVRHDLEEAGVILSLDWCGNKTIHPSCSTTVVTEQLMEVIWADDLAIMILAPTASNLLRRVAVVAQIVIDHSLDHGLEPNMSKGKTEAILSLRGKESVAVRKKVYATNEPVLDFDSRHWGLSKLRVVTQYSHLGGKINHLGNDKMEIFSRLGHAKTLFNQYRRVLFQSPQVQFDMKAMLMLPLVLSTLQYAMGTWSNFSPKVVATARARLLHLYQRLLVRTCDFEVLCQMPYDEILAKTQLPDFEDLLHVNRLRHLGSLLRVGPKALWALLEHEQTWLEHAGDSMRWLWKQLEYSIELQHPDNDWNSWSHLIQLQPKRWAGLLARAQKHAILQRTNAWCVKHWTTVILESLVDCGLQPDWSQQPQPSQEGGHLCAPCQMRFRSASAWAVHAFKCHGRIHYLREYLDHSCCKSCATEYWSIARLHRHLRYSKRCAQHYLTWHPRVGAQPGLNSRHYNETEPPVLSPPVDAVVDHVPGRQFFGADPESEPHDELLESLVTLLDADLSMLPDYNPSRTIWSLIDKIRICLLQFPIPCSQIKLTWTCFAQDGSSLLGEDSSVELCSIWGHHLQVVTWKLCPDWLVPARALGSTTISKRDAPAEWLQQNPSLRWDPAAKTRIPRVLPERFVVHFFAGRRRPGDLQSAIESLRPRHGVLLHVLSLDLIYGASGDLLQREARRKWLHIFHAGLVLAFWSGPPCESWSAARHNQIIGVRVRPIRSAKFPWALPSLSVREIRQILVANLLMMLSLLCFVLQSCWGHHGMLEHPAPSKFEDRASIWRTVLWNAIKCSGCSELLVHQGHFGAKSPKPTFLGFTPSRSWYNDMFQAGRITNVLPTEVSIGIQDGGGFHTTSLKEYPQALNMTLARIYDRWADELEEPSESSTPIPPEVLALFETFEVAAGAEIGADYQPPNARVIQPD